VGSENIEVTLIKQVGSRLILDGFGKSSNKHVSIPLTADQAEALKVIRSAESGYTYDGDARAFLLGTEALRINSAYQFDPLFAVSSSIVDPLPHQIEAVYKYLLPLPKIRFLLADDTGAGKTIMTGLLLKELLFRGTIERILIVTPAGLTKQWQEDELSGKFGLSFILVDRVNRTRDPDILNNNNFCIASIDFLRQPDVRDMLGRTKRWDIVVVDEAHKPAAYKYGNKLEENDRYKVIKILSDKTDHLLLLTATPHRGRKDTFRYLLQLLDRDLFQKDELVKKHITNTDSDGRNRFFLRRLKEEMVDWNGKPLFKPRYTKTVGYTLTEEESDFYEQITQYVRTRKRAAKEQKNRNVELALIVLQRRLASSLYAVTKTLENRKKSIEYVLDLIINNPDVIKKLKKQIEEKLNDEGVEDIEDIEGLDDEKRQIVEDLILRSTLSTDPEDIQDEIDELKRLLNIAYSLKNHEESKYIQLKKLLDESDVIRDDKEKLVIFTEYYDTLTILQKRLEESGYQVTTIHGGMDLDERKEAQVKFFHDAKILIATDAAGEGINLQFCHYLINWDIPWNPNRLEQRMGRIHRYGQKSDVHVFNLVASNTREGIVLQTILKKLDVMREQLGTDRVYDVIDELLSEVSLTKLIENAIDEDPNIIKAKLSVFDQENTTLNKKAEDLISDKKVLCIKQKYYGSQQGSLKNCPTKSAFNHYT
jgi:SNF2 family DNA or RNA helicase